MSDCRCGRQAIPSPEWCAPAECPTCRRGADFCRCEPLSRQEEETTRGSWRPVDLGPVLDGTYRRPEPAVGTRDDGKGLFYPGRVHTVASEAEGGKTWFALTACAEELTAGNACTYIDFEDDEGGIVTRLMALGVVPETIRARFIYIRPDEAIDALTNRTDLGEMLADTKPVLAVLDGVTEAMSLHGLELKDNSDIARFGKLLPRWIAKHGPAVVALDHVVKDREGRGRYALGGVHKLNGIDGAMYLMENREPFGIGRTGRSSVLISKDRPGQLRRNGVKAHDSLFWYADLILNSHTEEFTEASLAAASQREEVFRPTAVMARVAKTLEAAPSGLSKNAIEGAVSGKATVIRLALELLVGEGFVAVERRGPASIHTLARPYAEP